MFRKLFVLLEVILVTAGIGLVVCAWEQRAALEQPLKLAEERLLDVPPGASPGGTLNRLEAERVIDGAFWVRLYWRFNLTGQGFHSGEYRLIPGMDMRDLLAAWQKGDVVQYNLTLVEGWNFRQLRAALARQPKLEQTLAGLDDARLMESIGHPGVFPEGRFFPDTYRYVRGTSDADVLKQAYNRLESVLTDEWDKRAADAVYTDRYQALTMASLVEKETGVPQERGQIAGVFLRRLQQGMLLQTDPTVIYGLGERYNGKLTRALLKEPTPYNTYVISGLPPTPISLVGREAIHAALNPAPGASLYFVARGDGSHIFSDDLDAHNAAVREYQLNRRADYRSSPAPLAPPAAPVAPESATPALPASDDTAGKAEQEPPSTPAPETQSDESNHE